ncbi:MAG: methyltransferase [Ilumatobacteraceae bacterium]
MSNEHFSTSNPTTPSHPVTVTVALPDGIVKLTTDKGVFSYGALDLGTKVLLLKAPAPPSHGNLLDLGSGTGAIAITLAKRSPTATVWAVDVNQRALRLTRDNARANGVTTVNTCTPDEMDASIVFDAIWSNPPIHIGKPALHAVLLRWLPRLARGGVAIMVVQKHLGSDSLQAWLTAQGYPTERVSSAKGYRLLRTVRAPAV